MRSSISAVHADDHGEPERYWQAVIDRDATLDGVFVFAVKTTGVYCRPSCPCRRPKRENVAFFSLNSEAEQAGFRPCKRCRPKEPSLAQDRARAIETACALIDSHEGAILQSDLAARVGMSVSHFHRIFRAQTGLTPKAYALALRKQRIRRKLKSSPTITAAIHEAGYGSSGQFYEHAQRELGMPASDYRKGGSCQTIRFATAETTFGLLGVAATDKGICAIRFGDTAEGLRAELEEEFPKAQIRDAEADFSDLVARVVTRIEHPETLFELPLDVQGTVFQRKVWQALAALPRGKTATYGEVARAIGAPKAVRAVASACAANPVAVVVPCHRVVRKDGQSGGYRWGPARKKALLARERGG